MSSGIPHDTYIQSYGEDQANVLNRNEDNSIIPYEYTDVNASNGVKIVSPNYMSCHASFINDEFMVGLGSHTANFTVNRADNIRQVSIAVSMFMMGIAMSGKLMTNLEKV